jgi:hypothetical protein
LVTAKRLASIARTRKSRSRSTPAFVKLVSSSLRSTFVVDQ